MATDPNQRLLIVEEFLEIEFGPNMKAELDDGVIRMMAGGTRRHARIQQNLAAFFDRVLIGSGCQPFGSDVGVATSERSMRYPDLTIDRGFPDDQPNDLTLRDPRVVVEVLSPSTRTYDERTKVTEYKAVGSIETIILVDAETERCRVIQRTGKTAWTDISYTMAVDMPLPSLDLVLPHDQIFRV